MTVVGLPSTSLKGRHPLILIRTTRVHFDSEVGIIPPPSSTFEGSRTP